MLIPKSLNFGNGVITNGVITVIQILGNIIQTSAKIKIIGELMNFEYWRLDRKIFSAITKQLVVSRKYSAIIKQ